MWFINDALSTTEQDTMNGNEENIRSFACRVKEDQVVLHMSLKKYTKTPELRYIYETVWNFISSNLI